MLEGCVENRSSTGSLEKKRVFLAKTNGCVLSTILVSMWSKLDC